MSSLPLSRRTFLSVAGLAGVGVGVSALTAACAPKATAPTPTVMAMDHTAAASDGQSADDMDAMHKAGVELFVTNAGKDPTFWRQPMAYATDGDVKVFEVTCTEGKWNLTPDQAVDAMMYNGMVPGPEMRVTEGDQVRVICNNQMTQSTAIHFHGV